MLRQILTPICTMHDVLTRSGFVLAQACLLVIVGAYAYEVVARYMFRAPTWWSNEIVAYALCIGTFLALPEVTRRRGHIAITFLIDALPHPVRRVFSAAVPLVAALTCLMIAKICFDANILHWQREEMLVRVRPVPKIWLSVFLTYGFASSALHFARQIGARPVAGGAIG